MQDKLLYAIAVFDEETLKYMEGIQNVIKEAGIAGQQTPGIPHHITLASYDTSREEEIKELLEEVCSKTRSFDLAFNHIGLFGLRVMFLAPDVNYELLELHNKLDKSSIPDSRGWTAHVTLLIDEDQNIQKAIPLAAQNFGYFKARIESVRLYEFFPSRFIGEYKLQQMEI